MTRNTYKYARVFRMTNIAVIRAYVLYSKKNPDGSTYAKMRNFAGFYDCIFEDLTVNLTTGKRYDIIGNIYSFNIGRRHAVEGCHIITAAHAKEIREAINESLPEQYKSHPVHKNLE